MPPFLAPFVTPFFVLSVYDSFRETPSPQPILGSVSIAQLTARTSESWSRSGRWGDDEQECPPERPGVSWHEHTAAGSHRPHTATDPDHRRNTRVSPQGSLSSHVLCALDQARISKRTCHDTRGRPTTARGSPPLGECRIDERSLLVRAPVCAFHLEPMRVMGSIALPLGKKCRPVSICGGVVCKCDQDETVTRHTHGDRGEGPRESAHG